MYKKQFLISIIVPNYNRAHLITETLYSLKKQTYQNWEAIVVDDGSTDQSVAIINELAKLDNRIKFIQRDREPKGAPTCRNIGFANSAGDYVIFLDSDDLLAPYCLSTRMGYFQENPDYDFLVFPMLSFKQQVGDSATLWNKGNQENDLHRFLRGDPPWAVTCPIWKRPALEKIGKWDEETISWQDWELHVKAIVLGCTYKVIDALPDCFVRRDSNERISQGDITPKQLYSKLKLFEKIYYLLKANNQLTIIANKHSFANLLFYHAEKSAVLLHNEYVAEKFSKQIKSFKLIHKPINLLQLTYIKLLVLIKDFKLPFFSTLVFHLFRLFLPDYLTTRKSTHYQSYLSDNDLKQVNNLLENKS